MEETTDKAGDDKLERKEAETETNTKTQMKVSLFFVKTPTQPQLNSTVGFDTKMTLIHHHPPTQTQCQQYLSCH